VNDRTLEALQHGLGRFAHVDLRCIAIAACFQLLGSCLHAVAWRNMLAAARPDRRISLGSALGAHLAGVAGNGVAPAHAGDGLKMLLIRRAIPGTAIATIATTILCLTGVDIALGGSALVAAACTSVGPSVPHPGPLALAIVAAVLAVGGIAAYAARHRLRRVLGDVRLGAALLRNPVQFARQALGWQVCAYLARVVVAFFALHAFGLPASLLDAVLVVVVTGVAGVIPFLPGGVGAQQAMLVYVLRSTASAASVVSFGVGLQMGGTLIDLTAGTLALALTFRTFALRGALRAARRTAI
jgi:uncharacterized membrane protein YbhN (UPF0104 family)